MNTSEDGNLMKKSNLSPLERSSSQAQGSAHRHSENHSNKSQPKLML